MQLELDGRPLQAKVNVADAPAAGVIASVKLAIWPEATLWLPVPETAAEKSKPVPYNGTVAGVERSGELMVNDPVAAPLAVGWNEMAALQFAPAASVPVQLFWLTVKADVAASEIELMAKPLPLLIVTVCAALD